MQPAMVRILHPHATEGSGPLVAGLAAARRANAARLERGFRMAGATDVRVEEGLPDGRPFGSRLRELVEGLSGPRGLVVLGSGAIPLARRRHFADLLETAWSGERRALANSFYSADVVAIGEAANLASVPDLPSDNALPRWLRDVAGYRVDVLRGGPRLGVDIDSPLDLVLLGRGGDFRDGAVRDTVARLREVASDPTRELIISGRTSATMLLWLERHTASRTRALVEERGLRSIARSAAPDGRQGSQRQQRPPRSALGMVLDDRGPAALGEVLAQLGDAAVVDSRVLLAHRLGPDESGWPSAEDRYASDLLVPDTITDPWLRDLTASARDSAIPVLLGGHTLVGPGLRFVVAGR